MLVGRVLTDGHDVFVEVGVTTGLVRSRFFLFWLFGAARTAGRCSFLGLAAAMIGVELVEPINVAVLPLAFLALGAATAVRLKPDATIATPRSPWWNNQSARLTALKANTMPERLMVSS